MENNWVYYEDPDIYDGWILQFNTSNKKIKWREFWIVERLSNEQRLEIEEEVKKNNRGL